MRYTRSITLRRFAALSMVLLGTLVSCDMGTNLPGDVPELRYTILAQDSSTLKPLDSVQIEARTEFDTVTGMTKPSTGRADLAPVFGRRAVFLFTRDGYLPSQLTDSVAGRDSALSVVERILKVRMVRIGGSAGAQTVLLVKDAEGNRITGAQAAYEDSLGIDRTVEDATGIGQIPLSGLAIGKSTVLVTRSGRLGRRIEVQIARLDPSTAVPRVTATLLGLSYGIEGTVSERGLGAAYPLASGSAEFRCKDSAFVPAAFRTLIKDGRFALAGLPPVDGEVRIFRTANGVEPAFTRAITALEVMGEAPLAPITVQPKQDSAGLPLLTRAPADTLLPGDTLRFEFNQRVALAELVRVGLPNISNELFISAIWDTSGRGLKLVQKLDAWIAGKRYDYTLRLRNAQGAYFNRPGDTLGSIVGGFSVKSPGPGDTALTAPNAARWAFFNSGENPRFDSLDANSSRLADSTTRFARLRWSFPSGKSARVDSLVLFLRDGTSGAPSFTRLEAYPASLESVTVDFGSRYAIRAGVATTQPAWPLRLAPAGSVEAQLVPKSGDLLLDSLRIVLPTVAQGMGPSVWAKYDIGTGLTTTSGATDTILVSYRVSAAADAAPFNFGAEAGRPTPRTTLNGAVDSTQLSFKWIDGRSGQLIYRFNQFPPLNAHLKADLDGVDWLGRPIWVRNPKADVTLP